MGEIDYQKIFKTEYKNKKKILAVNPNIVNESGIYLFYRTNEKNEKCVYVGQATKSCLARCAQHLEGWHTKNPSHIDLSLKSHGLWSFKNPYGWKVLILQTCSAEQCDELEKKYIDAYRQKEGIVIYNITSGSQGKDKFDIAERKQENLKRYKTGKIKGKNDILKEIKTFFDKYLDYSIKGQPNAIKERKLNEFRELLESLEKKDGD